MKKKETGKFCWQVRAISLSNGAFYEVGRYWGITKEEAIENCRKENRQPFIFDGLKLEAGLVA